MHRYWLIGGCGGQICQVLFKPIQLVHQRSRVIGIKDHVRLTLLPRGAPYSGGSATPHARALARIEAHYFVHRSFLQEGQLLANAHRLLAIPGVIVQGRYDVVTPPVTAWELHEAWPASQLEIVPDAGHATVEPGIQRALVQAMDRFAAE